MVPESIPYYRVHAFTNRIDGGNPAGVCPLESWLPDEIMQAIATENGLSETAFFIPRGTGYHLRWFTPGCEVKLCGHATVATTFVLHTQLNHPGPVYAFETLSGTITCTVQDDWFSLNMPAQLVSPAELPDSISRALGATPAETYRGEDDLLLLFDSAQLVRDLQPDFKALQKHGARGFCVTALADEDDVDFVSRWFGGAGVGVDEDPVTGSAHRTLTPFWGPRLGKTRLKARQVSYRGGELNCELDGKRVKVAGQAVLFQEGKLRLDF